MELSKEKQLRIVEAIKVDRANYTADAKHATALGISSSVYNNIKQGKTEKQLSYANWIGIARRLGVALRAEQQWQTVETETFLYITGQLESCQEYGLSGLLCDIPNIGKTYTARVYAQRHPNVAYIDCSQVKTKSALIKRIASEFGVTTQGQYSKVYNELVEHFKATDRPLVILDEAGDLQPEAFLELKALWNAEPYACGWYMMGAEGLKVKIERLMDCAKVGYAEIFSRYGNRYRRITPTNEQDLKAFTLAESTLVARANAPEGVDAKSLARKAGGLRRVYIEIMKLRHAGV